MTSDRHLRLAKRWTPHEDAELLRLYEQGLGHGEIGARLGRTPSSIQQRLTSARAKARRDTTTMAMTATGPLSTGQRHHIQESLDRGLTVAEIAAEMSLPERTIQQTIDNHNMIAAPPRNVYRAPAPKPAAAEPERHPWRKYPTKPVQVTDQPFTHRRIEPEPPPAEAAARDELLNDIVDERPQTLSLPPKLCVVCAELMDQAGDMCTSCDAAASAAMGEELASLAPNFDASSSVVKMPSDNQSGETAPISQPTDDWEPYVRERPHIEGVLIVLRRGASIALSPDAYELLGSPAYVTLLYSRSTRRIGIRPTDDPTAQRVTGRGPMREVGANGFARKFGVPFEGTRYPATVIDGVLVAEVGA